MKTPRVLIIDPSFNTSEKNHFTDALFESVSSLSISTHLMSYKSLNFIANKKQFVDNFYTHIIVSGSNLSDPSIALRDEDLHASFLWLTELKTPSLWICAGHQILGLIHGSRIIQNDHQENTQVEVLIHGNIPLFGDHKGVIKLVSSHLDSITVPNGFDLLASSAACPNQIMMKQDEHTFSFQAHPELNQTGLNIILRFFELEKSMCVSCPSSALS
jgi:GMP synthase-like glutamine amidotransferase